MAAQNAMLIQRLNDTNEALKLCITATKACWWCRTKLWVLARLHRWKKAEQA
jgi:hypothetical protein